MGIWMKKSIFFAGFHFLTGFNKRLLSVLELRILLLCLCMAVLLFAAEVPKDSGIPKFVQGEVTRVDTDNKYIGGDHFVVYVPSDYTDEHSWPVIFFYNGVGGGPSTRLFRKITEGKGFIIIGMEYIETGKSKMTRGQYINNLRSELKSILKAKKYVSEHLRIDDRRLFLTGFSRGGWHSAALVELSPRPWAGVAIIAAGRRRFLSFDAAKKIGLRDKPIYIGAGETDTNMSAAKRARKYYRRVGANVTFEEYKGVGHMFKADSKILRNWLLINSTTEDAKSDQANEQTES